MTTQAQLALKAVTITKTCGRFALNHGVLTLWRLAMQLDSVEA